MAIQRVKRHQQQHPPIEISSIAALFNLSRCPGVKCALFLSLSLSSRCPFLVTSSRRLQSHTVHGIHTERAWRTIGKPSDQYG
eukprot:4540945-Amphidinium_carterae.1